jgi:glucose-6-phosphate-specific signal transduction histidine kinase
MAMLNIILGTALLFFGRRAFWLFVAGAGFVAGLSLANNVLEVPESIGLIIGIGIGLLAGLLAVFVQRFAINLAGFLVGGYIALQFLPILNLEGGWWTTVLTFIVGGIIGVVLVGLFLEWALISLSSLVGASLVTEALNLSNGISLVVFIILIIIGVVFQARELRQDRHKSR